MQATWVPFMMLALIFLLPRYCSSIQVQTAGISDVQTYFSKTNLTKSFWWIFESEFRLKNSIWKVEEVEISYTNPVLPQNSPDPGALALPDGSGSFLLVSLYSRSVILRLCIGDNVQFCTQVGRRPCSTTVFFHWPGLYPCSDRDEKLCSGELDSQGPRVSIWGLARLGRWKYVGTRDPLCQWHFCHLLHRWVLCNKKESIYFVSRRQCVAVGNPQSPRWCCHLPLGVAVGTLHWSFRHLRRWSNYELTSC